MNEDDAFQVAVIENHNNDAYENAYSTIRNNYYPYEYLPSSVFNGGSLSVGGSTTEYHAAYNNAIAVMSDFTLDMTVEYNDGNIDVTVDMEKVATYAGTNLVLHLTLTESHIPENWGGLTELNFVNRAMYPDANGTVLDFSSNTSITKTFSITPDPSWNLDNGELIAFIQNNDTKEILQSNKAITAIPVGSNNVKIAEILSPDGISCINATIPEIKVKNRGAEILTSMDIAYDINGEITGTINWTGSLEFNEDTIFTLEELTYTQLETNSITITLSNPNGATDDDPSDNELDKEFYAAVRGPGPLVLEVNTDNWGSECTWEIKDANGAQVINGGPYESDTTETIFLNLDEGCYTFFVYDAVGDGGEEISITDLEGTQLFFTNGSYGSGTSGEFGYEASTAAPSLTFDPENGTTDATIDSEIVLTFNMPVRNLDDSPITNSESLLTFKMNDASGSDVAFTADINENANILTITPSADLEYDQTYYIAISDQVEGINDTQFAGANSTFSTVPEGLTGLESRKVSVYPNPVSSKLTIDFDGELSGFINIALYDITGALVYSAKHDASGSININCSDFNFTSGIYFLNMKNEKVNITQKINIVK